MRKPAKPTKKIKKMYSNKRDVESMFHEKNQNLDDKKKHIRKDDNKIGLLLCHSHIELRLRLRLS